MVVRELAHNRAHFFASSYKKIRRKSRRKRSRLDVAARQDI
jgi:hypothetical protein